MKGQKSPTPWVVHHCFPGEPSSPVALQESILSAVGGLVAPGEEAAGAASAEAAAALDALRRQEVRAGRSEEGWDGAGCDGWNRLSGTLQASDQKKPRCIGTSPSGGSKSCFASVHFIAGACHPCLYVSYTGAAAAGHFYARQHSMSCLLAAAHQGAWHPPHAVCLVQELVQQERSLLEAALASPSAAHPTEGFGSEGLSLAQTRRRIAQCIQ